MPPAAGNQGACAHVNDQLCDPSMQSQELFLLPEGSECRRVEFRGPRIKGRSSFGPHSARVRGFRTRAGSEFQIHAYELHLAAAHLAPALKGEKFCAC